MCTHKLRYQCPSDITRKASAAGLSTHLVVLLFVLILLCSPLFAQIREEDYEMVENWQLPETAIEMKLLELRNDILFKDDEPFDGWAYELYPEGNLLRASKYLRGLQHGPSLLWYPDGTPQMSANYQNGALHGRFLGWYPDGSKIYDMYINRGTYAADNLIETDQDRRQEEIEFEEREGSTNDSTGE
ncbi:MAG: hypothetical protein PWP64_1447 [Candidatus Cloacimonadota bacterium]|nr:hypothetical protein [Candidatus Cloacimonadota bacterium]